MWSLSLIDSWCAVAFSTIQLTYFITLPFCVWIDSTLFYDDWMVLMPVHP
jgi:hypothetical protein